MKQAYYALGRIKPGELNKTEQAFCEAPGGATHCGRSALVEV